MKILKKLSIWLVVLFLSIGSTYLNAQSVKRLITAGEYEIVKIPGTVNVLIKMKGYTSASFPGKPILPYKIIEIPLPKNADLHSLKLIIDDIEEAKIKGNYTVGPAKQPISPKQVEIQISKKASLFTDNTVYKKDSFFPAKPIKLLSPSTKGIKGGKTMNFVRVAYSPIQYNPITKKLKIIKKANISIIYETIDRSHMVPGHLPGTGLQLKSNYVIITTSKIKNHSTKLQYFVNFKKSQGFSIRIITENHFNRITTAPYPNRRAEKIREWLRKNYQTLGIEYVLLIGNPEPDDPMYSHDIGDERNDLHYDDDNYIPMKMIWNALPGRGAKTGGCIHNPPLTKYCDNEFTSNAPFPYGGVATDWYYADLTGNWDIDGDGFYGEAPMTEQNNIEISSLPCGLNREDDFAVRWIKNIDLNSSISSQPVKFELKQWPAARMFIDGNIIFDHYPQTKRESDTVKKITLSSGPHTVIIEYFKNSNHGHIFVRMNNRVLNGFKGEYFNDFNMSNSVCASENNETMWKNWETSDYASSGGVDLDAEVSVGRIPVYNNNFTALDNILAKLIADEGNRYASRKILLPMRMMDNPPVPPSTPPITPSYHIGEAIMNDIAKPSHFSTYRIYDANYSVSPELIPCNPDNVVKAWNNYDFDMVTWMTHGKWRYANNILDVKYQLNDLNKTIPVVMAASCSVGNIYLPDCYPVCPSDLSNLNRPDGRISLGYSLLKEGKANAVVSATQVSSFIPGDFVPNEGGRDNANFAYLYTKEIISKHSSVGDALKNIKYTPFGMPMNDSMFYRQSLIYNLYGDPSYYPLKFHSSHIVPNFPKRLVEPIKPPIRRPIWSPSFNPGIK